MVPSADLAGYFFSEVHVFISGRAALAALRTQADLTLSGSPPDPATRQAAQILLDALDLREVDEVGALRARKENVAALWRAIAECLAPHWLRENEKAVIELRRRIAAASDVTALQTIEFDGEALLANILAGIAPPSAALVTLIERIAAVEAVLTPIIGPGGTDPARPARRPISVATLTDYLRRALSDPSLLVTALDRLPGGFGKETFLFSAVGRALTGDFVLRLDHPSGPLFAKDCHLISNEYALICAVHALDYPMPAPVFAGLGDRGFDGSDLIIVQRSPGQAGGEHLPGSGKMSDTMVRQLAVLAARLHAFSPPPALEVTGATASRELLTLTREECTRRNISGWRDYWLTAEHSPSCALVALYTVLLRLVPSNPAPPRLVHGDFGLHNCMVREGAITAVIDWESAHHGEPAEDVAYTIRMLGDAADPDHFLDHYRAAGGAPINRTMLTFYDLMAQVRTICICNLSGARFSSGAPESLKLLTAGAAFVPYFLMSIGATVAAAVEAAVFSDTHGR